MLFLSSASRPNASPLTAALCPQLNAAAQVIVARLMPAGFDIDRAGGAQAPGTYRELRTHMRGVDGKPGRMLVSRHGLDGSIYADREINAASRAWHDWHHYHGCFDFSPAGEYATWERQAMDLFDLYGDSPLVREMIRVLHADIVGQSQYYERHKKFVADQRGFVEAYIERSVHALDREW